MTVQANGQSKIQDMSPPLLPWASKPWHNIQESVRIIQQHFINCLREGATRRTDMTTCKRSV